MDRRPSAGPDRGRTPSASRSCRGFERGDAAMVNSQPLTEESVVAKETGGGKFPVRIDTGDHDFLRDEPLAYGGLSSGPNPFDLLEAALAGCTLMTLRLYAE